MLTETGRVVAIERDCLWVEMIQRSSCGSCALKKGCGHSLLEQVGASRSHRLRVLLQDIPAEHFAINDQVVVSIPEHVLVQGALIVYLLPLLCLLAGALAASQLWQSDAFVVAGSVLGFAIGMCFVKTHAWITKHKPEHQPVILPGVSDYSPRRRCGDITAI